MKKEPNYRLEPRKTTDSLAIGVGKKRKSLKIRDFSGKFRTSGNIESISNK
jgi:hypothetical protein